MSRANDALEGLSNLFVLFLFVVVVPGVLIWKCWVGAVATHRCETEVLRQYPMLADSNGASVLRSIVTTIDGELQHAGYQHRGTSVVRRTWARRRGEQWVVGIVVQPADISHDPFTMICRSTSGDFAANDVTIDYVQGDRLDALIDVSMSGMNPFAWR